MGKTEIIQELARLTPQDLAEIRAQLDRLAAEKSAPNLQPITARIRTPRLANPSQSRDFIKQVIPAHA